MNVNHKLLKVDSDLIAYYTDHPAANISDGSRSILLNYSGAYAKDRIHTLIARGVLRAEINQAGRYQIYAVEQKPTVI
jgi:hypothetical protein